MRNSRAFISARISARELRDVGFSGEIFQVFGFDDVPIDGAAERIDYSFGLRFFEAGVLQILDDFVGVENHTTHLISRVLQAPFARQKAGYLPFGTFAQLTSLFPRRRALQRTERPSSGRGKRGASSILSDDHYDIELCKAPIKGEGEHTSSRSPCIPRSLRSRPFRRAKGRTIACAVMTLGVCARLREEFERGDGESGQSDHNTS